MIKIVGTGDFFIIEWTPKTANYPDTFDFISLSGQARIYACLPKLSVGTDNIKLLSSIPPRRTRIYGVIILKIQHYTFSE